MFTGAFVNSSATFIAVRSLPREDVTIVAMGYEACERCEDDDLFRGAMIDALQGHSFPFANSPARLRGTLTIAKSFGLRAGWAPEADFGLCTRCDVVPFAVFLNPSSMGHPDLVRYDLRYAVPTHV